MSRCRRCGHTRVKHSAALGECMVLYRTKSLYCDCGGFVERGERRQADDDPNFYFTTVRYLEHRPDQSYDEEDPGQVVHPNGSIIASSDRGFLGAAAACVLALIWEQQAA